MCHWTGCTVNTEWALFDLSFFLYVYVYPVRLTLSLINGTDKHKRKPIRAKLNQMG